MFLLLHTYILCHLAIVLRYVALHSPLRTVLATAGVGLVSTGAAPLSPQKRTTTISSSSVQSHLHRSPHPHQFLLSALLVFLLNSAVHPSASASSSVSTINLLILGLDPFLSAPLLYVSVSFGVAIVFLCPLFSSHNRARRFTRIIPIESRLSEATLMPGTLYTKRRPPTCLFPSQFNPLSSIFLPAHHAPKFDIDKRFASSLGGSVRRRPR